MLIVQRENLPCFSRLATPVLHELVLILWPLTNPNGKVAAFFRLALETKGTTFRLEPGDLTLDVAVRAVFAFLQDHRAMMGR
jgi:hypothetical protein